MAIDKDILGLAAEFAVASELCRRNIYAQLTLGLRKRTDLLVETETDLIRIQVKGKQGREWPSVKGLYGADIALVLVDFKNKKELERPDFYILTIKDWKNLLESELKSTGKIKKGWVSIDENNTPIWADGYKGMVIKPEMVKDHKEQWNKIKRMVGQ